MYINKNTLDLIKKEKKRYVITTDATIKTAKTKLQQTNRRQLFVVENYTNLMNEHKVKIKAICLEGFCLLLLLFYFS